MPTFVFDRFGMPDFWTPGPLIKDIIKKVADSVDKNFPDSVNYVIDATWVNNKWCIREIEKDYETIGHIDNIFICATADIMIKKGIPYPKNPFVKVYHLGSVDDLKSEVYRFDFPAISLTKVFEQHKEHDLLLDTNNLKKFLCFQNKPHPHRQLFTHKVINAGLINQGILTLQKYDHEEFLYSNVQIFSVDENIDSRYRVDPDRTSPQPIKDDHQIPYTLGDLSIWNRCFLTVTAETFYNWHYPDDPDNNWWFVSEKTWKPIIGMRPFVINGSFKILEHLEREGFYTFEELWKDVKFRKCHTMEETVEACFQVVQRVCNMSDRELRDLYTKILPKLQHNRKRFFEYASEQEEKIYSMFKNKDNFIYPYFDSRFIEDNERVIAETLKNGRNN